jgi:hypothetical protein
VHAFCLLRMHLGTSKSANARLHGWMRQSVPVASGPAQAQLGLRKRASHAMADPLQTLQDAILQYGRMQICATLSRAVPSGVSPVP